MTEQMIFSEREHFLWDFLFGEQNGFLWRYHVPEHWDKNKLSCEVNDLITEIDDEIPKDFSFEEFKNLLPKICSAVRHNQLNWSWPAPKKFILATKDAVASVKGAKTKFQAKSKLKKWPPDELEFYARKMMDGEVVGEPIINGRQLQEILERGLLDKATADRYIAPCNIKRTVGGAS